MNAAVTGGSGFFGGALVRALLERGDRVRALVRREAAAAELRSFGVEPVIGDLAEPDGCDGLVAEGDVLFHAAARVDMSGRWDKFQRTTIDGTRHLLAAVLPRRPRRVVYISTGAVYAAGGNESGLCAGRTPTRPAGYNFYGRAKLAAERLVQTECARAGCPWTILRLGFLFGAENRALLGHFVPLAEHDRLFIIGSGDNRIATLYIEDAVRAAILAGKAPVAAGKVYDVASDEHVTQREFIDATTDALGLPRCRRRIGRRLALLCAWLVDWLSAWANHESHISRATVALMSTDQVVDATRIRAELGWRPEVRFDEGIRRTREWYRRTRARPVAQSRGRDATSQRPVRRKVSQ
jgi:nucleoside-diphosphate-sugar epimerase